MDDILHFARKFLAWWAGELIQLLPATLRGAWGRGRARLIATLAGDRLALSVQRQGETRSVGALPLGVEAHALRPRVRSMLADAEVGAAEVVLVLPREQALRKAIELPEAAAENLREVISFELDRHTPFQASDVYFDGRLIGPSVRPGRIEVDLAVAPRWLVDTALTLLRGVGLMPDRLAVAGDDPLALNLLPPGDTRKHRSLSGRVSLALGLCAFVLLGILAYLPLWRMQDELAAAEEQISRSRAAALEADALRKQIEATLRLNEFLARRKSERPTVTQLLDEVARLLPDNTWIAQLTVRDRTLVLTGTSSRAAALIAELEQSRLLSGVSFSAPVTQDARLPGERFNLTATITQEEKP